MVNMDSGNTLFLTAVFLFFHDLTTVNEDIGRHIKLGEITWQTKSVPRTNLLSYTATDFPFINHHWLSEVLFYGFYRVGGLTGVMIAKIIILLAAYLILFLIVKNRIGLTNHCGLSCVPGSDFSANRSPTGNFYLSFFSDILFGDL